MHVRQRIGVLIARDNAEFILAGVTNNGNGPAPTIRRRFASSGATASNSQQRLSSQDGGLFWRSAAPPRRTREPRLSVGATWRKL